MSDEDFGLLQPYLAFMPMQLQQGMIEPGTEIKKLFFPESGFVSVTTTGSKAIEIGLIGSEGLVGASPVLLGSGQSALRHYVQAVGEAYVVDRLAVEAAVERSVTLRKLLLRFVHTLTTQMAYTAFANASYDIETRLARWLLMCQDRIGGDVLTLTHEFLSIMLGVQRTSVTLSLQVLEGNGAIKARRGRIEVRDRNALIDLADEAYGKPEEEYKRLIESK